MDAIEQAQVDRELEQLITEALSDTRVLSAAEQVHLLRENIREVNAKRIAAAVNARIDAGTPRAKQWIADLTNIRRALADLYRDLTRLDTKAARDTPPAPDGTADVSAATPPAHANGAISAEIGV